jgi:hypothetical protein
VEVAPELGASEALLEIDYFGLTSNNVTYAVAAGAMRHVAHPIFVLPDSMRNRDLNRGLTVGPAGETQSGDVPSE